MTNLFAFVGGVAGAVIGWVSAALLAFALSGYYDVSDFEGQRGMASIFFFGPIGGVIGLMLGTWVALRLKSGVKVGAKGLALRLPVVIVGIAALIGVVYSAFHWFSPVLNPNGQAPRLGFEIRLPPGAAIPDAGFDVRLLTEKNIMPASLDPGSARDETGRAVISGSVDLYYRSSWRILELRLPSRPEHLFVLRTAARPGHNPDFGKWEHVSSVGNGTDRPRLSTSDDAYDIRYRVLWPN